LSGIGYVTLARRDDELLLEKTSWYRAALLSRVAWNMKMTLLSCPRVQRDIIEIIDFVVHQMGRGMVGNPVKSEFICHNLPSSLGLRGLKLLEAEAQNLETANK
jgi:hypothetical protein